VCRASLNDPAEEFGEFIPEALQAVEPNEVLEAHSAKHPARTAQQGLSAHGTSAASQDIIQANKQRIIPPQAAQEDENVLPLVEFGSQQAVPEPGGDTTATWLAPKQPPAAGDGTQSGAVRSRDLEHRPAVGSPTDNDGTSRRAVEVREQPPRGASPHAGMHASDPVESNCSDSARERSSEVLHKEQNDAVSRAGMREEARPGGSVDAAARDHGVRDDGQTSAETDRRVLPVRRADPSSLLSELNRCVLWLDAAASECAHAYMRKERHAFGNVFIDIRLHNHLDIHAMSMELYPYMHAFTYTCMFVYI
jgi:hypothetical protein